MDITQQAAQRILSLIEQIGASEYVDGHSAPLHVCQHCGARVNSSRVSAHCCSKSGHVELMNWFSLLVFSSQSMMASLGWTVVWDHSWKLTADTEPCMQLWFDPAQGSPNDAVARIWAERVVAAGARALPRGWWPRPWRQRPAPDPVALCRRRAQSAD
ncbi:Folate receptor alpha [Amphibalanus amphitrite]|uniref:Folate receptor alpha n=1 Tax=Amphibalanus amphitrite TaxID=1232801 RepID=A0A6A4VFQ9_AMPAM|nr:Folate receptor alpha [Amphibalanus amphitrite]